jgi:anti-sigma factor RsiW
MMERKDFDQLDLAGRLEAFADGELPPDCRLEVMSYLAEHPDVMRRVVAAQRMRDACCRVIEKTCGCGCDSEVKRRIAELAQSEPIRVDFQSGTRALNVESIESGGGGDWGAARWVPFAAAAVFFVAALVVLNLAGKRDSLGDGSIIPVHQVEVFQWRHTRCSRAIDQLAAGQYPQNIEALPGAIADTLGHQTYPVLDLSQLGYEFDKAGPCSVPGSRSIHLIYKATPQSGRDDRISLWIEPDEGKFLLEPDKAYRVTGERAAHPMLVWKHGRMIYYLVGDADTTVQDAVATLTSAASPRQ